MPVAMPLSFVLLGVSRALFKLAVRTTLQRIILNVSQAALFAAGVYFWSQAAPWPGGLAVAGVVLLYLLGDILVTVVLFTAGLIQMRRRSG